MNDVLSYNNITKWQRITQCLNNDKSSPSKQLFCKSLVTDFHIANEDLSSAQSTIKSAYNTFTKHSNLSMHDREELFVRGFYEWIINFDLNEALKIFRFISNKYPFDLFAAKRAQEMAFDLSDWDSMLEIFENIKEHHIVNGNKNPKNVPSAYFNGLLSFAHEQKGNLLKAEEVSMEGLKFYIDDNWLQHSLIHSRYFQKNTNKDLKNLIKFIIENGSKYWNIKEKHAFITTHNWWHIALLYLELDDLENAEKIFMENIWREEPVPLERRADQIGALSMFWILTMIIDSKKDYVENKKYQDMLKRIENKWCDVMDYVIETNKNVNVGYKLYDLLFMRGVIEMKQFYFKNKDKIKYNKFKSVYDKRYKDMVEFCGDNDELKKKYVGLVDAMDLMYGENADWINKMWAYETIMNDIIKDLNCIGGSREQRFVFDQMYIDLLLMINDKIELKRFLKEFLDKYPLKSLEIIATNLPDEEQKF